MDINQILVIVIAITGFGSIIFSALYALKDVE